MRHVHVFKWELPIAVIIEGDGGELQVLELAPAGKKKLGAYLRAVNDLLREKVLKLIRRK